MLIKQISIFLENRPGTLSRLVHLLADNNIDLEALSIAESQDYGLLRIIVDKPDETACLLREEGIPYAENEVIAVKVNDTPGSLTSILTVLADNNISLAYSYAFLSRTMGQACIVLRVDDNETAEKLLIDAGISSVD